MRHQYLCTMPDVIEAQRACVKFHALVLPDTWHLRPDTFFTPSPKASPTRGATNPSR